MRSFKFLFIVGFVALFTSAVSAQNTADDDRLRSLVREMIDAQMSYSPDKLDKIFTSDYVEISPFGEFDERSKVLGFYDPKTKPDPDKFSSSAKFDEFSIRNYGKFAIVIVRVDYTIVSDGKTLPPRAMRLMLAFRKIKSEWKIASVQYTGIKPKTPKS